MSALRQRRRRVHVVEGVAQQKEAGDRVVEHGPLGARHALHLELLRDAQKVEQRRTVHVGRQSVGCWCGLHVCANWGWQIFSLATRS